MDQELRRTIRNLRRSGLDTTAILSTLASELEISVLDLFHCTMNVCTGTNIQPPGPLYHPITPLTPAIISNAMSERSFWIQFGTEQIRLLMTPQKLTLDELLVRHAGTLGYSQMLGYGIKWLTWTTPLNQDPAPCVAHPILGTMLPEPGKRYTATRIAG